MEAENPRSGLRTGGVTEKEDNSTLLELSSQIQELQASVSSETDRKSVV